MSEAPSEPAFEGGCVCGRIRFRATGTPGWPHTCSCTMCRRHAGAPSVPWVEFAQAAVAWTGRGGAPASWRSSANGFRTFCPDCGTAIGARTEQPVVEFVLGVFDDPTDEALRPRDHTHTEQRPSWWRLDTGS